MTICRSHNMNQLHARQQCPRCGHLSQDDNSSDKAVVPVYCVPACVESVELGAEGYWRARS